MNIQLQLGGDQQLKFLEELVSLLHQSNNSNGNEPEAPALTATRPAVNSSTLGNGQRSDSNTPPRHVLRGSDSVRHVQISRSELTSPIGSHSTVHAASTSTEEASPSACSASGPRFPHPHPPSYPPPQRTAPPYVRPSSHLKKYPSIDVDVDPHLYLNEAELAIISSNSWQLDLQHSPRELSSVLSPGYGSSLGDSSNLQHSPRVLSSVLSPGSSLGESRNEAGPGTEVFKSRYWLRENGEHCLQEWLRKKDGEYLLKKRKVREIRRREHRKEQAEAARRTEREDKARAAYQKWLLKKTAEGVKVENRPTVHREEQNPTTVKQQHRSLQRRPHRVRTSPSPSPVARQPTGVSPTPKTASIKQDLVHRVPRKRPTFEEWLQCKDKDKPSKRAIKYADKSLPEDLQQIAKGLRKLRLQRKEYSKRHVYTGMSLKRTAEDSKTQSPVQRTNL